MAPDEAVPPRRGEAEDVLARLRADIAAGSWADGRLPTERLLAQRYGVARNTLRRALAILAAEGTIGRRVGRGTFMKTDKPDEQAAPSDMLAIAGMASPAEVLECRLMFEPGIAALAVARASHADLLRIEACLAAAATAPDVETFETWDAALHDAIAAATRNRPAIAITRAMAGIRSRGDWGQLKARSMTPAHRAALQAQHENIVAALKDRDAETAQKSMRDHLLYVRGYMFGGPG